MLLTFCEYIASLKVETIIGTDNDNEKMRGGEFRCLDFQKKRKLLQL